MHEYFKNDLELLISETLSDAHTDLKKADKEYNQNTKKLSEIYELFMNLSNNNPFIDSNYLNLIKEYFELQSDIQHQENTASYLCAFRDCIWLLARSGWIKENLDS